MALALVDFGREQGFQVAEVRVPLAHGLLGERATLPGDGRQMQHFAVLQDRRLVGARAAWRSLGQPPRDSSVSYAATLGSGR